MRVGVPGLGSQRLQAVYEYEALVWEDGNSPGDGWR